VLRLIRRPRPSTTKASELWPEISSGVRPCARGGSSAARISVYHLFRRAKGDIKEPACDRPRKSSLHSTAHYFLRRPERHRSRVPVSNFGTDHAPLIEEMARGRKTGGAIQGAHCPHENTRAYRCRPRVSGQNAMHCQRARRSPLVRWRGSRRVRLRGLRPRATSFVHSQDRLRPGRDSTTPYATHGNGTLPSGVMTKRR